MSWTLLGLVVLLVASWWVGWRVYLRLWGYQRGHYRRCEHCGQPYKDQPTYCPHCGEVVAHWSNRR
ncbi:MAG TPA: hypothetical protein ENI60_09455 [Candidatus Fraserbacteria bacterium]|nr:hypothetical protein [Candidatus Fraserbacteria bacterium]